MAKCKAVTGLAVKGLTPQDRRTKHLSGTVLSYSLDCLIITFNTVLNFFDLVLLEFTNYLPQVHVALAAVALANMHPSPLLPSTSVTLP